MLLKSMVLVSWNRLGVRSIQLKVTNFEVTFGSMPKRFSTSLYLPDLKSAVADAEKVVGYPTSFLSLRYLLSDEVANVALQLRKLVGSSHPLLHTVEHLLRGSRETESSRGLVVLLMAKAAGQPLNTDIDSCTGVSSSQRTLAELTETIHLAQIIHRSIPSDEGNRQEVATKMREYDEGNKMAILSGDFLLAHASKGLASLCNTKVVSMISQAIADFAASQFMSTEDTPGKVSLQRWIEMKYYESASLLAHACCGAVTLANHGQEMQEHAFNFGKHLSLAWQANLAWHDLNKKSAPPSRSIFTFFSEHKENQLPSVSSLPPHSSDLDGESLRSVCCEEVKLALEELSSFPASDARNALKNILDAVLLPNPAAS